MIANFINENLSGAVQTLLTAVTFVMVLYLLVDHLHIKVKVTSEGIGASTLGHDSVSSQGFPSVRRVGARSSSEGFSSSGNEAPSFHMNVVDASLLNQSEDVGNEPDGSAHEGLRSRGHTNYVQGMAGRPGGLDNLQASLVGM